MLQADEYQAPCRPNKIDRFTVDRYIRSTGVAADIRRFGWPRLVSGVFAPDRHYLDFSLRARPRHARLASDHWHGFRNPGEIFYFPAGQELHGESVADESHLLCLTFDDPFLDSIFGEEGRRPVLPACPDVRSPAVRLLLGRLAKELTLPGFASDVLVQSTVIAIVVELARDLGGKTVEAGDSVADARQVRLATEFVQANLEQELTVAGIARECGISPRHLARVFKCTTGMTLGEYIASRRIARAKELLSSRDMRIKEISWRCGFASPSAFSAAFRGATGVTPGQFRSEAAGYR